MEESAATGSAVVQGGTSIPPGIRVSWSERQDRVSMMIEAVEPEDPSIHYTDEGLIVVVVSVNEVAQTIRLQLYQEIDSEKTRWVVSGRGISFEVTKLRIGRWGQLVTGKYPCAVPSSTSARDIRFRGRPLASQI